MYANRIDVLHRADGDDVAELVAHDLELDFLPAGNALFDKNLGDRREAQTVLGDFSKLLLILADASAGAAQRICRTNDNRIVDGLCKRERILNRLDHFGRNNRLMDGDHGILELLTILRLLDGFALCTEKLDTMLLKESFLRQLH